MPRALVRAALGATALVLLLATAAPAVPAVPAVSSVDLVEPPLPEAAFAEQVSAGPCTPEDDYEKNLWTAGRYPACERLRFRYGPIPVRPGQNDGVLVPVTIEKPAYDGYIVRFKPDLHDATGKAPGIEKVHLHHATWLNLTKGYGNGPFAAAGEEKTTFTIPDGYGFPIKATDTWQLLYMVHNAVPEPTSVWVTYDVDYVPATSADAAKLTPAFPLWLDVQANEQFDDDQTDAGNNPVFNVHRGFGSYSEDFGQQVCTWPRENCARFDQFGEVKAQQGKDVPGVEGTDWTVTKALEGTLVQIGGHLHPGGLRDEVSLVRNGVEKPIHYSDAIYWDRDNPGQAGGPINTWDFSMTTTGAALGWKVNIKAGDKLRLNAVIDSETASWYENMGIVMTLVAPGVFRGVDPFDPDLEIVNGVPTGAKAPVGSPQPSCTNDADTLCLGGQVTHGHLQEASVFGGCGNSPCPPLPTKEGRLVSEIQSTAFTYGEADFAVIGQTGIPRVRKGQPVKFVNPDTAGDIWHTFTRCKEPCTGAYGLDYPIADGGTGPNDHMDFDSTEIGYGLSFSPAAGRVDKDYRDPEGLVRKGLYYEFTPNQTGTFTFWCRVHPSMRGAFKVID